MSMKLIFIELLMVFVLVNGITNDQRNADNKDCTQGDDPIKKIQCTASQYQADQLTVKEAAIQFKKELKEFLKEDVSDAVAYGILYDWTNRRIGIAQVKSELVDWMYSVKIRIPRMMTHDYIYHYYGGDGPVHIYSMDSIKGNDIPNHYSEYTALDGTPEDRIVYVQREESSKLKLQKGCADVSDLPDHFISRKHVSIIMKGNHVCTEENNKVTSVIGAYEKKDDVYIPRWECNIKTKQCKGKITNEERKTVMSFLV